jgi:hypothetical protein
MEELEHGEIDWDINISTTRERSLVCAWCVEKVHKPKEPYTTSRQNKQGVVVSAVTSYFRRLADASKGLEPPTKRVKRILEFHDQKARRKDEHYSGPTVDELVRMPEISSRPSEVCKLASVQARCEIVNRFIVPT